MAHKNILDKAWPQEDLDWLGQCPICSSTQRRLLHDNLYDCAFSCAPGTWSLYQCSQCNSAYLDPRPSRKSIFRAYEFYYTHETPQHDSIAGMSWKRRLRRMLANGYRNWRFGTKDHPASVAGVLVAALLPDKRAVLDRQFRDLPKVTPGGKVLDIGCGDGSFLNHARSAGWEVVGCDTDPVVVNSMRKMGLDAREGGVDVFSGTGELFDVVTLSHVIEHVFDPIDVLKKVFELLKRGGRLWMETPNIESAGHQLYGQYWRGIEAPRHLVIFTWTTLVRELEKIGFSRIQKKPHSLDTALLLLASEDARKTSRKVSSSADNGSARSKIRQAMKRARMNPDETEYISLIAIK